MISQRARRLIQDSQDARYWGHIAFLSVWMVGSLGPRPGYIIRDFLDFFKWCLYDFGANSHLCTGDVIAHTWIRPLAWTACPQLDLTTPLTIFQFYTMLILSPN